MKKFAKTCARRTCDLLRAELDLPPARGARWRTLANEYLCSICYEQWMGVRHMNAADTAAGPAAAVGSLWRGGGEE